MTPDDFRQFALALPDATEGAHMGHPDFRVGGRIFATLSAQAEGKAMVKLPVEDQATLCAAEPDIFLPVPGGWGRMGCTHLILATATERAASLGLRIAWQAVRDKAVKKTGARVRKAAKS